MRQILSIFCGLAICATASTAHAQIEWAQGAPGGTSVGSIELVPGGNLFLETGIAAAQIASTGGSDYTVSAWIKSSEGGFDEFGLPSGVAGERWWFGTGFQGLHLGIGRDVSTLTTGHWNNDSSGTTDLEANVWVHATHVYRNGIQEVWLDGRLESSTAAGPPNADATDLQIGSRHGINGPSWGGCIDDVAIFNVALAPGDIPTLATDTADPVALGAVAYYNFEDDQTGTTAANLVDVATSGLTGTDGSPALQQLDGIGVPLPPQAEWTTGAPGGTSTGALSFDGTRFADTGISADVLGNRNGGGSDYTVSAWIRSSVEAIEDIVDPVTGEVTGTNPTGNADNNDWWFGTGDEGIHFGITDGSTLRQGHWGADSSGVTAVPVDTWVHVAYTFDADAGGVDAATGLGLGVVSIYYNGEFESSAEVLAPNRSDTDLRIGSRGRDNAARDFWNGSIDDVAIFTSALSGDDVEDLFQDSSQALNFDSVVAYYNFEDDQTGSTAANLVDSGQVIERIAPASAVLLGDANCDGEVDFRDIVPFIALLSNQQFKAQADVNESGTVDFSDIVPFIAILSAS